VLACLTLRGRTRDSCCFELKKLNAAGSTTITAHSIFFAARQPTKLYALDETQIVLKLMAKSIRYKLGTATNASCN
jgi:hypothetical protein